MNYLSLESAKTLIRDLKLSPFFINVIDGTLSSPLDIYFGCPTLYYLNRAEQEAYKLGDILPLWQGAGGYMQYAYDINIKDYIAFNIEYGEVKRYKWDDLVKFIICALIEHEYDEHEDLESTIVVVKELLLDLSIENFDEIVMDILNEWEGC